MSPSTVETVAHRAREAAHELALATRATKDEALHAMADALVESTDDVLAANAQDLDAARENGTPDALLDRLRLDAARVAGMADGLRDVAALPDPVGEVVRGSTLANGLELRQVRVPFGVVGIIYEARPNVTADAAGICLKSGSAVLLRGSSSARRSNQAVVAVLRGAAAASGLPADAVQLVPGEGHEAAKALMRARGLVDVLIPRGGAGLIRSVVEALQGAGVTVHGDAAFSAYDDVVPATDEDWGEEYLSLDISARVVPDLDEAVAHIRRWSSQHSDAIVTEDQSAARRFTAAVDSAAVLVNASTRFTDGGEFGFGAEIGISTQKLHARGPMGLTEMTTTKYVVTGEGHVR